MPANATPYLPVAEPALRHPFPGLFRPAGLLLSLSLLAGCASVPDTSGPPVVVARDSLDHYWRRVTEQLLPNPPQSAGTQCVVVGITITADGRVRDAEILFARPGNGDLAQLAIPYVSAARYAPTPENRDRLPVRTTRQLEWDFPDFGHNDQILATCDSYELR